jgi:hypothetical protein
MNEKETPTTKEHESIYISKSLNKKKLIFYSNSKIMVHIRLVNGEFRNGYIEEEHTPGIWRMKERKMGDINLFEDEIKNVEDYTEQKEGDKK